MPEQDSQLLAYLDERVKYCRVTTSFNASEEHAVLTLDGYRSHCPFYSRVVYAIFTVFPVEEKSVSRTFSNNLGNRKSLFI